MMGFVKVHEGRRSTFTMKNPFLLAYLNCNPGPQMQKLKTSVDPLPINPLAYTDGFILYILLRVAAGVDHHIWCSAWGRLGHYRVPAILWRSTSASLWRLGVFSFAFANEILFAWQLSEYLFTNTGWGGPIYLGPNLQLVPLRLRKSSPGNYPSKRS